MQTNTIYIITRAKHTGGVPSRKQQEHVMMHITYENISEHISGRLMDV